MDFRGQFQIPQAYIKRNQIQNNFQVFSILGHFEKSDSKFREMRRKINGERIKKIYKSTKWEEILKTMHMIKN